MKHKEKTLLGCIILCAFVVASILTPALAAEKNVLSNSAATNTFTINGYTYPIGIPNSMVQAPEYVSPTPVLPKSMVIKPNFSLGVTLYGQGWSPWGSEVLVPGGVNETMANVGCAVTSAAMVFKYFGVNTDPGGLCTCSNNNGLQPDNGFQWGPEAQTCSSNLVSYKTAYGFSWYNLRYCLYVDQSPPILWLQRHDSSGYHNHFIVVTAYANQGSQASDFTINDPMDGTAKSLSYYLNSSSPWYTENIYEYKHR